MKESKILEFKERVTDSFLKTVSAFANYGGGSILFGVDDEGNAVGVADPKNACLAIENRINDCIKPQPAYSLAVDASCAVIELKVEPGRAKPYLYRSRAYRRADASTVEVDPIELSRLVLEGSNINFEQLSSSDQGLTFEYMAEKLTSRIGIESFGSDTLKTLNLLSDEEGFDNAAALLADKNSFPGIDMVQFGESVSVIRRREIFEGESLLRELDEALRVFDELYCYEVVEGFERHDVQTVPREAFREAVANALVHRRWDVPSRIRVSLFDDRIEVASPGGLPYGITEREYLNDMISAARNPILVNVFFRLGIIEALGTGIRRIREAYEGSMVKPCFDVSENVITVTLPVLVGDAELTSDQKSVYLLLSPVRAKASSELAEDVPFSRTKLNGILKQLVKGGIIETVGAGRGLKYRRVR